MPPSPHTHTHTLKHNTSFSSPDWPGTQLQGQPPIAASCLPSAGIGNVNQHTWFLCTHYEFSPGSGKTNEREWRKHTRKPNHVSLHCGLLPDLSSVHMPRPLLIPGLSTLVLPRFRVHDLLCNVGGVGAVKEGEIK